MAHQASSSDDICIKCKVRCSPSALELYGKHQDMTLTLDTSTRNAPGIVFTPLAVTRPPRIPSRASSSSFLSVNSMHSTIKPQQFQLDMNNTNHSVASMGSSCRALKVDPLSKSNRSTSSRSRRRARSMSPSPAVIPVVMEPDPILKESLLVSDIIICEIFKDGGILKITSISNGIYELSKMSEIHRDLLTSCLANLLPNERLRACEGDTGEYKSVPFLSESHSFCSFDMSCDSISLDMEKLTSKKIKQLNKEEDTRSYLRRKCAVLGQNLTTRFQDCFTCGNYCFDMKNVHNGRDDKTVGTGIDLFSFEEETIVAEGTKLQRSPTPKQKNAVQEKSLGEEGSFVEVSHKSLVTVDI